MATRPRFVSVALNPAVDRTVEVEELRLGEVVRGRLVSHEAAGKGVNVARTLAALGHEVTCTGFIGRTEAAWFSRSLGESGAAAALVRVAGVTRENLTYLETSSRRETHIVEAGFDVKAPDIRRLRARLATLATPGTWTVVTGRPAPGFAAEDLRDLVAALRERGARVAVDSSGDFLRAAVKAGPDCIKPNVEELAELVGEELRGAVEVVRAAGRLANQIGHVVVSLGPDGAWCVTTEGAWHAVERPRAPAVSTVGCGDALLAGFAAGLAEGGGPAEALRLAVACGGACARSTRAALVSRAEAEAVRPRVQVTEEGGG